MGAELRKNNDSDEEPDLSDSDSDGSNPYEYADTTTVDVSYLINALSSKANVSRMMMPLPRWATSQLMTVLLPQHLKLDPI
jgi:hypothetical protein